MKEVDGHAAGIPNCRSCLVSFQNLNGTVTQQTRASSDTHMHQRSRSTANRPVFSARATAAQLSAPFRSQPVTFLRGGLVFAIPTLVPPLGTVVACRHHLRRLSHSRSPPTATWSNKSQVKSNAGDGGRILWQILTQTKQTPDPRQVQPAAVEELAHRQRVKTRAGTAYGG